jgi:predicted transcriptional regulator
LSSDTLTLRIGIASREAIKQRTTAIAKGELTPRATDPKIWFSTFDSLAKVLSERNMLLLETIRRDQPKSLTELSALSGRAVSNLSRTLRSMERIGLIELREEDHRKFPVVRYDRVTFDVALRPGQATLAA